MEETQQSYTFKGFQLQLALLPTELILQAKDKSLSITFFARITEGSLSSEKHISLKFLFEFIKECFEKEDLDIETSEEKKELFIRFGVRQQGWSFIVNLEEVALTHLQEKGKP